jgi:hypothetical protein
MESTNKAHLIFKNNSKQKEIKEQISDQTLPANSCGFTSALSAIIYGEWKQKINVTSCPEISNLIGLLKGAGEPSENKMAAAIKDLVNVDHNKILKPIGEQQDAFTILTHIMGIIKSSRKIDDKRQILPVYGCACGNEGATMLTGCLDFVQTTPQDYTLTCPECDKCNSNGTATIEYLPHEFFIRIRGCETDFGDVARCVPPFFKNYYITGIIQYNRLKKHFRYIKVNWDKACIYPPIKQGKRTIGYAPKEELMNEQDWTNYIYTYSIGKGQTINEYKGIEPFELTAEHYYEGLYGGADDTFRIIQWNLRSTNQKTAAAKKRIIRNCRPLVALLNETRQNFEVNEFSQIISKEAPGAHRKRNAQILLHNSLHYKIRKIEVDYVSIMAYGHPLSGPTLIACCYLSPHRDARGTTRQDTVNTMEEDITEYVRGGQSTSTGIIIGGDFNATIDEMEEEAVNGSWIF